MKGLTVLVTGGGGFIGSHLVEALLHLEADVHILERPGYFPWRLQHQPSIKIHAVDMTDSPNVAKVVQAIQPHIVYHLVAYGVDSAQSQLMKAIEINVLSSLSFYQSLSGTRCQKIIQMGSSAEYGNHSTPLSEETYLTPTSYYGATKACNTLLSEVLLKDLNIPLVTLRPFNIFGPSEEPHKIFSFIILKLLQNEDVPLTACTQYRDYIFVKDVVNGLLLAATSKATGTFNIARGEVFPLKYYTELIYKHCPSQGKLLYGALPYRDFEVWKPEADNSKAIKLLQWKPQHDLEASIIETIQWYRENLNMFLKPPVL